MTNQTTHSSIGKTIAKHRKNSGLTQETVAELLGISVEAVSRLERGTTMPSLKRLAQFSEIFNCTTIDLLTQSSKKLDDQALHLQSLLTGLNDYDLILVLEVIENLTKQLKQRY